MTAPPSTRRSQPAPTDQIVLVSTGTDPVRSLPVLRALEADIRVVRPAELAAAELTGRTVLVDVRDGADPVLDRLRDARRHGTGTVIAVTDSAGLPDVDPSWAVDDVVLDTAPRAELVARLRLRRGPRQLAPTTDRVAVGGLVVDRGEHVATLNGRAVPLTFREFCLLAHLVERVGQVVARDELMRTVWDRPGDVASRTIDVHVARLRRKLGPQQGGQLLTVRKVGYRLTRPTGPAATSSTAA